MQSVLFQNLINPRDIRDLPRREMHAVMAARYCIVCNKVGRDPIADLSLRFGNVTAAKAFIGLFEAIGSAWPEPFTILRPCCAAMSVDEAVLSAMVGAAGHGDRVAFDEILSDMIEPRSCRRLFNATVMFVGSFRPAPIEQGT